MPAGAWQQCVGHPHFEDGEPIWIGVDLGGEWSASALAWVNSDLQVGCALYYGDSAVLDVAEHIRHLGATYSIREVAFDMWRAGQLAAELEREGVTVSAFPMTDVRTIPASARLHAAIVEQRITLPDDPDSQRTPRTRSPSTPGADGGSTSPQSEPTSTVLSP